MGEDTHVRGGNLSLEEEHSGGTEQWQGHSFVSLLPFHSPTHQAIHTSTKQPSTYPSIHVPMPQFIYPSSTPSKIHLAISLHRFQLYHMYEL